MLLKRLLLTTALCLTISLPAFADTAITPQEQQARREQQKAKREAWLKEHPDVAKRLEEQKTRQEYLKTHPEERQKAMAEQKAKREAWIKAHPEVIKHMEEQKAKRQEWAREHPGQPFMVQRTPQEGNKPVAAAAVAPASEPATTETTSVQQNSTTNP